MLKIQKNDAEAVWCETIYNGEKIRLKIKPTTQSRMSEIRAANTTKEFVRNTKSGSMEIVKDIDDIANAKALADEIIVEAEGFENEDGTAIELTKEVKYDIYLYPAEKKDDKPLWEWILEQAGALQGEKDIEIADDIKNS